MPYESAMFMQERNIDYNIKIHTMQSVWSLERFQHQK